MNNKDTFSFGFKDRKKRGVFYSATYSTGGSLKIKVFKNTEVDPNSSKSVKSSIQKKIVWDVLFNNASFQDILGAVRYGRFSLECEYGEKVKEDTSDQKFVALIRDCPVLLCQPDVLLRLINILERARWGNSRDRKVMQDALEYLLPNFKGGEKPIPGDINYRLVHELLKKLAEHLAEQIKPILNEYMEIQVKGKKEIQLTDAEYYSLKQRLLRKDRRLYNLSKPELETLAFKPSTYARQILSAHIGASIKTLSRRTTLRRGN